MTRIATILCFSAILLAVPSANVWAQGKGPNLKQQFEKLDTAGKHDEIVSLWKENPFQVLYIIDSYLEGSLKLYEEAAGNPDGKPDEKAVQAMHDRAHRGALAADAAFGRSIFSDYTCSFIGWDAAQKKDFRAGQKAFGAGRKAMKAKDYAKALDEGRRCLELAQPLGDWWGTAMGLTCMAEAHENLGQKKAAITAYGSARLIHHNLGLAGSEYRNLMAMARILEELGQISRALNSVDRALELGEKLGDSKNVVKLLEAKVRVLEKSGNSEAAKKTAEMLEKKRAESGKGK